MSRGITFPISASLRFHPGLKHPGRPLLPCMVALITRGGDGEETAIHRTFLKADGSGKALVSPNKMMLGPSGGGAFRLANATDSVMVGEGIETCLAVMQATGRPAWAALSTSGLRLLDLPRTICDVIVLADGDPPGESAATAAARRWRAEGRSVRIARPPAGVDFNDLLIRGAATTEVSA
ncbi:toprim domain-containing protein [Acuticoccus sp. MNP-M23]|uniref:toprim domain-containing protein n=1 Tax=Acuticoccus sp. MNP-M23 TaxID=3072793 RepID=UPI0028168085|nr:toprim domain-containing protein [Acuticoccus sp. MNP-M23]WMS41838.1 toprim domain-containing protein [Acuticoccus sp. MNP-M23]